MLDKEKQLEEIALEIVKCRICKQDKIGVAVPGEGSPDAKVVFIGEAPGKKEAISGRPFVGRSGQLLRRLIAELGFQERDVYITSPVKYLPKSGTPTPKEIAHGAIHLHKQLDIIKPKFVVLLGKTATRALLDEPVSLLKEHGKIIYKGKTTYFVTLHPAAALRFQKFKKLLVGDFKNLKQQLLSY